MGLDFEQDNPSGRPLGRLYEAGVSPRMRKDGLAPGRSLWADPGFWRSTSETVSCTFSVQLSVRQLIY